MRGCIQQRQRARERAVTRTLTGLVLVFLIGLGVVRPVPVAGQADPNGLAHSYGFLDLLDPRAVADEQGRPMLTFVRFDANDALVWAEGFESIDAWCSYARADAEIAAGKTEQVGWTLCHGDEDIFWPLQALLYLCPAFRSIAAAIESRPILYDVRTGTWGTPGIELTDGENLCYQGTATVSWNPTITSVFGRVKLWHDFPPLVGLAHELVHAQQRVLEDKYVYASAMQVDAMKGENLARYTFFRKVPGNENLRPRPGNQGYYLNARFQDYFDDLDWADWSPDFSPLLDVFEEE